MSFPEILFSMAFGGAFAAIPAIIISMRNRKRP